MVSTLGTRNTRYYMFLIIISMASLRPSVSCPFWVFLLIIKPNVAAFQNSFFSSYSYFGWPHPAPWFYIPPYANGFQVYSSTPNLYSPDTYIQIFPCMSKSIASQILDVQSLWEISATFCFLFYSKRHPHLFFSDLISMQNIPANSNLKYIYRFFCVRTWELFLGGRNNGAQCKGADTWICWVRGRICPLKEASFLWCP